MRITSYILCILIGYLLGTSNMAYFIARFKQVDLRSGGSGNLGTSNAVIMMGKKAGVIVLLHDILKTVLAVLFCRVLFPNLAYGYIAAGVASVIGHIFPFYLKFKGGKGFASYIGMLLAVDWRFAVVMILIIVLVSLLFDWIVAGTFSAISLSPIYFLFTANYIACLIILIGSVCIFLKHLENIRRRRRGQEMGMKQALFKKQKQSE